MGKPGKELHVNKAVYYDPNDGPSRGTEVTSELASLISDNKLVYNGAYNNIFPDHFKRVLKRLKVEGTFKGKNFTKYYNENEKINLPIELGGSTDRWWERTPIQTVFVIGAIASIVALVFTYITIK